MAQKGVVRAPRTIMISRKAPVKHHKRSGGGGFGGGSFGVDFGSAGYAAIASWIGTQLKGMIPATAPKFLRDAPVQALGLYGLGVLLKRRDFRSIGAGLAIGQSLAVATAG